MDYEVFKDYYLSASIHFIWEYRVVEDYLPVIDKAIQDTFNWFEIAEIQLINKDLGVRSYQPTSTMKRGLLFS